ncbi:adenosine deaminase-like protein isoform X1 [Chenopodium quinoa]|uniref:adenosine deaminase-like protein isoform X1 n=1 Tax=Chenopodium quinoa TaxID=63459 RepID=UPI000B79A6C6|nr:adenosine deaminase-like protein isoform X1 [Chenopodium quinoa]XP_021766911.1 adenosine deaminase-like protein isoform X1 [Chenopodium quinoa]
MEMMDWWVSMPKVELHAHLNGSVRNSTLLELAKELGEKGIIVFSEVEHVILKNDRSLTEVFKLFDLIHILTTDHATVTRITKEVVEDFAAENVVYLELRTTPKRNDSRGMSKRSYMEAVIEGLRKVDVFDIDFASTKNGLEEKGKSGQMIDDCVGFSRTKIYVRLLLSIDRRETLAAAMETVKLALEMKDLGVVGIDLSGNPKVGEWITFLPALRFAREQGLRVTLHCGEVPNQEEIHAMLDFLPERIGHACCLEEDAWRKLKNSKIPVEICLTSNIRTNTISSIDVHHFADLYNTNHPLILCTDDTGVFSTSLSKEYAIAATAFGLGKKEMFQLARTAVEYSFVEEQVASKLKDLFDLLDKSLAYND